MKRAGKVSVNFERASVTGAALGRLARQFGQPARKLGQSVEE
jgi:hypothetical protein